MAKFCGQCGSPLSDNAQACSNCGTPCSPSVSPAAAVAPANIPNQHTPMPSKTKMAIGWVITAIILIVVLVIVFSTIAGRVGYKGLIHDVMNAYEDYEVADLVEVASHFYDDWNENSVGRYFSDLIYADLDWYENRVGHNFSLQYDIDECYDLPEYKLERLLDRLSASNTFDADCISTVKMVEITVTAKGNSTTTKSVLLTLTKEDGEWRLLYLNNTNDIL